MIHFTHLAVRVGAALLLISVALPARGQGTLTPRGDEPGTESADEGAVGQRLTMNASLGGGVDNAVFAKTEETDSGSAPLGGRSSYGQLSTGLSYALQRTSGTALGASFATTGIYVPDSLQPYIGSYGGAVGVSLKLTERTSMSANQSAGYQPYYTLDLFPALGQPSLGQAALAPLDLRVNQEGYATYGSMLGVTHTLSRRSSIAVNYAYTRSDFTSGFDPFTSHTAGARFSRTLTRNLAARVGYAFSEAQATGIDPSADRFRGHNLDVGVDYNRPLSLSRRTTLSFGSGSTATTDGQQTYYNLTGDAQVSHELGRSWRTSVRYSRGVTFYETFQAPALADTVAAGVAGRLHRRVALQSSVGTSFGQVGLSETGSEFRTSYTTVALAYALTRLLRFGTDYSYMHYSFGSATVPFGFLPNMQRHTARAYLSVRLPLLQPQRRPNASR